MTATNRTGASYSLPVTGGGGSADGNAPICYALLPAAAARKFFIILGGNNGHHDDSIETDRDRN